MYNPQLETFICVVESGSFNKAAERLYITPPAVIKQINLLEDNLDLQLFIRTHRGLVLTKAGESFYRDCKYIIQYCKDSVARAKNVMHENTDWNFSHDPCTDFSGFMAKTPEILPKYQVSANPF